MSESSQFPVTAQPTVTTEMRRADILRDLGLMEPSPEAEFADIVELAATICGKPLSAMTLLDETTQRMKARVGFQGSATIPADVSICQHTIRGDSLFMVPDTRTDERFAENKVLEEANIRFYAGMPLVATDGTALGALCVMDTQPSSLTAAQQRALEILANQLSQQIQFRERALLLARTQDALADANTKLSTLALTDALTSLWNRRAFDTQLEVATIASRRSRVPLALILLDIDNFKSLNDRYGHPHGDEVIRRMAAILTRTKRAEDSACRYGGEEFAILLPNGAGARILANRFLTAIRSAQWDQQAVTASIGLVVAPPGTNPVAMVAAADAALYRAKRAGKNQLVCDGCDV